MMREQMKRDGAEGKIKKALLGCDCRQIGEYEAMEKEGNKENWYHIWKVKVICLKWPHGLGGQMASMLHCTGTWVKEGEKIIILWEKPNKIGLDHFRNYKLVSLDLSYWLIYVLFLFFM